MAYIKFENVTLKYPIYNTRGFSLRTQLLRIGTGGLIESEVGSINYITALNNVSFEVNDGDSIGIIGHNGSGKTTLLRTMAGIFKPEEGIVETKGKLATLFEQQALMENELSGYENITRVCLLLGLSMYEAKKKVQEIEEFTELGNFLQFPVRTYSTGMSMRLSFAISTSINPEIFLIDEIFEAGDKAFREKAKLRMKNLINTAKIFMLASHSPAIIKEYCNRLFVLDHGKLREEDISYINN